MKVLVTMATVAVLSFLAIIGIWALIDFDSLFLVFHHASFSNDLWKLDPSSDYLIMMFPEEFFMDASFILVGSTILEALICGAIAYVYLRRNNAMWKFNYMWRNC